MYNSTNRDRKIIEKMKRSIVQAEAFVVDLYNLNRHGQERYRNLTWLAIEELARCGSLEEEEVVWVKDKKGGIQVVRVEGPFRELVDALKDEIAEIGALEWRSDRLYQALTEECAPLLLWLTSYACREFVNELSQQRE